jgi:predicted Na+-dependent transporter
VRRVSLGLFAIVVVGAIASEYDKVVENIADVAAAALTLNPTAMTLSFVIAKLSRLSNSQSITIELELGTSRPLRHTPTA